MVSKVLFVVFLQSVFLFEHAQYTEYYPGDCRKPSSCIAKEVSTQEMSNCLSNQVIWIFCDVWFIFRENFIAFMNLDVGKQKAWSVCEELFENEGKRHSTKYQDLECFLECPKRAIHAPQPTPCSNRPYNPNYVSYDSENFRFVRDSTLLDKLLEFFDTQPPKDDPFVFNFSFERKSESKSLPRDDSQSEFDFNRCFILVFITAVVYLTFENYFNNLDYLDDPYDEIHLPHRNRLRGTHSWGIFGKK
ncbi:hypothetical protein RF11_14312 [Thelohanellus kitauei]|uniref:Uncharacterized protein n=1 Tax=Thelohanellus kitauei TaxID=669202 RepID=A0A0C2JEA5_THEKT|nr:hypothetical protein RF11_14312 [Thelohanellus kitauei]